MAAVEYGTVAVVPKGEWSAITQYDVGNLVSYDGSSYVAKILPPLGTLPTDLNYWQVSAQGTGRATANTLGTVKPDGTTTEVDGEGALSVKTATQTTEGIVKGSAGISVGNDGAVDVNTTFEQAAELANIIAGEAIASVLGKVSKTIAATMSLDQNALLKNMLTNIDVNDKNKIPTSAFVHTLVERIGMGENLGIGSNLTNAINTLNGNLTAFTGKIGSIMSVVKPLPGNLTDVVLYTAPTEETWVGMAQFTDGKAMTGETILMIKVPGATAFRNDVYVSNSDFYSAVPVLFRLAPGWQVIACAGNVCNVTLHIARLK